MTNALSRALAKTLNKNYIINGGMMVSQENANTPGATNAYYPVDQFFAGFSGTTGAYSVAQVASPSPGGSPNRIRFTVTGADAAVAAGDLVYLARTPIEGLRVADLMWGTASAKTVILQFGVKAPAGTYCVGVRNGVANRAYVAEYTISAGEANTDTVKSVIIPGDTTGTWAKDNTSSIDLFWTGMSGTSFQQTAGSWAATGNIGSSNQFNLMGTNGNVFELFDVGLYEGTAAPAFQLPDYVSELALCQRYFFKNDLSTYGLAGIGNAYSASQSIGATFSYPVRMRAVPTMTVVTTFTVNNCAQPVAWVNTATNFSLYAISVAASQVSFYGGVIAHNARM
ncbi:MULTISPECIES: hypothetical protein [unclassified Bradyrhizobium]|uniref:hypothetical protein n=1 Tax=unclassified Bradyrhizobium TaxID=2631580 RepID=UPI003391B811